VGREKEGCQEGRFLVINKQKDKMIQYKAGQKMQEEVRGPEAWSLHAPNSVIYPITEIDERPVVTGMIIACGASNIRNTILLPQIRT